MSERQDSASSFPHIPFSLHLRVSFCLILIFLIVPLSILTARSWTAGEEPPDLSPFPWIYMRDGHSLDPDENVVEVLAVPVWAGPRPRLMTPEDSESLLAQVRSSPRRLHFVCDAETCRLAQGSGNTASRAASGLFWGGSVDLTGDGVPEDVRRVREQVIIYQDGGEVWRSPSTWRVSDLALGDPNDDGRSELMLALWKPGLDGLEPPDPAKRSTPRSHPFIVGYRGGTYRTLWGGSAVAEPIQELALGDVDGDGVEELIALEGVDPERRTVSVWRWHGWGFSLMWRSRPGWYRDLTLIEDQSIGVAVD